MTLLHSLVNDHTEPPSVAPTKTSSLTQPPEVANAVAQQNLQMEMFKLLKQINKNMMKDCTPP